MKKNVLFSLLVVACATVTSCVSCTPEDVDAFADGFKEGYFGEDYDKEESDNSNAWRYQ